MDPTALTAMAMLETLAMSAYMALRGASTGSWWDLTTEERDTIRLSVLLELEAFATGNDIPVPPPVAPAPPQQEIPF